MKKLKLSLIFFPLLLGILIYLLYRSKNLFYYNLIHYMNMHGYISLARKTALIYRKLFPTWSIYSLPDGLWLFSTGIAFLMERKFYIHNLVWYTGIYFFMILTEFIQKFYGGHGTIIGTFDRKDILAFTIAYISVLFLTMIFRKFENEKKYEKRFKIEMIRNIEYTLFFFFIGLLPSMI